MELSHLSKHAYSEMHDEEMHALHDNESLG